MEVKGRNPLPSHGSSNTPHKTAAHFRSRHLVHIIQSIEKKTLDYFPPVKRKLKGSISKDFPSDVQPSFLPIYNKSRYRQNARQIHAVRL